MTWIRLSLKEWQRRPLRTSITAAGIAIAIGALFTLLSFERGYREGVRLELERLGAHVLVVPKGCPYDAASTALHGASWPCYLKESYLKQVRAIKGTTAAPVLMSAFYDADGNKIVYLGVDANIRALRRGWVINGRFPEGDHGLLVGCEAARRHGWQLGDRVPLPGLKEAATGKVEGILEATGGADDTFIYLPLNQAQRLFHRTNELTHILVRLADPNDLDSTVAQLRGCEAGLSMNVVPLAHLFHTIQSLVNSNRCLLGCVALVALLVAGAGVSNTILMAVAERGRDLAVMRAVGASSQDIFRLVCLESVEVCVVGGCGGLVAAFLGSRGIESWLRKLPFAPMGPLLRWDWRLACFCMAGAVALGTVAGLLPAWRAARVLPAAALRNMKGGL
jgi:ABC-type lipoprotein release transport system permease subunit